MSFKNCVFPSKPHHLYYWNITAVNAVPPTSAGFTAIPLKLDQKMPGSPNDGVQWYKKGFFFKFKP